MRVAPRRQWVLAATTLGGMLLVFPWVVLAISRAPVTDNPASLPKWRRRRHRNLLQFGGRSARVLSAYWRRISWLAPLRAVVATAVLAYAALVRPATALPLGLTGAGALVLLAGGIWWVRTETTLTS